MAIIDRESADTNTAHPTGNAARAEQRPGDDAAHAAMARLRSDRVFRLVLVLASSGIVSIVGGYALVWGDSQDSFAVMLTGTCLMVGGVLAWLGSLGMLTRWIVRDTVVLARHWLKGVRNPSRNADAKLE